MRSNFLFFFFVCFFFIPCLLRCLGESSNSVLLWCYRNVLRTTNLHLTFLWHQEEQIMSEPSLLVASYDCKANVWILKFRLGSSPVFFHLLDKNDEWLFLWLHLLWFYMCGNIPVCVCVCLPFSCLCDATLGNQAKKRNALLDHLLSRWSWEMRTENVQTIILLNVCPLPLSLCASATSAGSPHGLDNTNGGVCRSKSMKLVLRVGQSEYFMFVCQSRTCESERESGIRRTIPTEQSGQLLIILFWILVRATAPPPLLDLLSGQIISIIYSVSWREIAVVNYLKSLVQTAGSLRPSALSRMRSLGQAAVNNLFFFLLY